jgi:hypothetical protein
MERTSLTNQRIDNAECPPGKSQAFIWHDVVYRLGLQVTRAGAKSYIFEAKLVGKTARVTIGKIGNWTVENAPKEAKRPKKLVDQGIEFRLEKNLAATARQQAETQREKLTMAGAWSAYIKARSL